MFIALLRARFASVSQFIGNASASAARGGAKRNIRVLGDPNVRSKWLIATSNSVLLASAYLGITSWAVAIPFVQKALGVSAAEMQLGSSALVAGYAVGSLVQAELASWIGLKRTGLISIVFLVITQLLIPFVPSYPILIALRVIQGSGIPFFVTNSMTAAWFPVTERGVAVGMVNAASLLGLGIGGLLTGLILTIVHSWQMAFVLIAILCLIVAAVWSVVAEDPPLPSAGHNSAAIGSTNPYRLKLGWIIALSLFCLIFQQFGVFAILPTYLYDLGYQPAAIGTVVLVGGVAAASSGLAGGFASDALIKSGLAVIQARTFIIAIPGMVVAALGTFLVPVIAPHNLWLASVVTILAVWNLGGPLFGALPTDILGDPRAAARLLGMMLIVGLTGGIVSPYVVAAIGSAAGAPVEFVVLGTVVLVGAALAAVAPNLAKGSQYPHARQR